METRYRLARVDFPVEQEISLRRQQNRKIQIFSICFLEGIYADQGARLADQRPPRVTGADRRLRLDNIGLMFDILNRPFKSNPVLADYPNSVCPCLSLWMADGVHIPSNR